MCSIAKGTIVVNKDMVIFGVDKRVLGRVCYVATDKSCVKGSGEVAVEHSRK